MKKLLGILVLVALLAAPAMAQTVGTTDVNLVIESYIRVQNVPTDITITLIAGQNTGTEPMWYWVVSNDLTPEVTASIAKTGDVGTWSIDTAVVDPVPTAAVGTVGVQVFVNQVTVADVGPGQAVQTSDKEAEVTITVAVTP